MLVSMEIPRHRQEEECFCLFQQKRRTATKQRGWDQGSASLATRPLSLSVPCLAWRHGRPQVRMGSFVGRRKPDRKTKPPSGHGRNLAPTARALQCNATQRNDKRLGYPSGLAPDGKEEYRIPDNCRISGPLNPVLRRCRMGTPFKGLTA
ncbi:hypothetical protein LZ30DRAFT_50063 [Colletotrichum cereale]|nr:hypothetical protein LZ30DRAFT_50063 [Colletotrichum cereale]